MSVNQGTESEAGWTITCPDCELVVAFPLTAAKSGPNSGDPWVRLFARMTRHLRSEHGLTRNQADAAILDRASWTRAPSPPLNPDFVPLGEWDVEVAAALYLEGNGASSIAMRFDEMNETQVVTLLELHGVEIRKGRHIKTLSKQQAAHAKALWLLGESRKEIARQTGATDNSLRRAITKWNAERQARKRNGQRVAVQMVIRA